MSLAVPGFTSTLNLSSAVLTYPGGVATVTVIVLVWSEAPSSTLLGVTYNLNSGGTDSGSSGSRIFNCTGSILNPGDLPERVRVSVPSVSSSDIMLNTYCKLAWVFPAGMVIENVLGI